MGSNNNAPKKSIRGAAVSLAATLLVLQPVSLVGQSAIVWSEPTTISVESGRPLEAILDRLQTLYRFPISYEDVPYEYASDIKVSVRPNGSVRGAFPVGGRLDVVINSGTKDVLSAVQQAVDAYYKAGYPGKYQVIRTGSAIDVVPVAYRAADGKMKDFKALMSEPVVVPQANRTPAEHLEALCVALSKARGVKVESALQCSACNGQMQFGATGELARDAASLLIKQALGDWSVRALYEPGDKTYYVSVMFAFQPLPLAGK